MKENYKIIDESRIEEFGDFGNVAEDVGMIKTVLIDSVLVHKGYNLAQIAYETDGFQMRALFDLAIEEGLFTPSLSGKLKAYIRELSNALTELDNHLDFVNMPEEMKFYVNDN